MSRTSTDAATVRGKIDYVIFDMDGLLSELFEMDLADSSVS